MHIQSMSNFINLSNLWKIRSFNLIQSMTLSRNFKTTRFKDQMKSVYSSRSDSGNAGKDWKKKMFTFFNYLQTAKMFDRFWQISVNFYILCHILQKYIKICQTVLLSADKICQIHAHILQKRIFFWEKIKKAQYSI